MIDKVWENDEGEEKAHAEEQVGRDDYRDRHPRRDRGKVNHDSAVRCRYKNADKRQHDIRNNN